MIPNWILNNNEPFKNPEYENSFFKYLVAQKRALLISFTAAVTLFAVLKFCFPIPDFFVDSYTYVADALYERPLNYRPIGYADFLSLTHIISSNANFTVLIQYILFFTSTLFCFFSTDYLYGFPKKIRSVVFYLVILNPILILQTNLISSDSLFCSLTVTWFTLCLWIIRTNNLPVIIMQVIFLLMCFHIRYVAAFYPIVAIAAFLFSGRKLFYKTIGIILSLGIIYSYVERQKELTESKTHVRIFSGFSGWQIANNVLCYYKEITVDSEKLPTEETKIIDRIVKKKIDNVYEPSYVGTKYIWDKDSPLKFYLSVRVQHTNYNYFDEWLWSSIQLSDYGWSIIRQHPYAYIRYFMAPNFKNYLLPDREILVNYNNDDPPLPAETKLWFDFQFDHLFCRFENLQKDIIYFYPVLSCLLNLANILIIIVSLPWSIKTWRTSNKGSGKIFFFWCFFYFGYMLFCLFSTVVLLRYLDLLFVIGIIMPFILLKQIKRPAKQAIDASATNDPANVE